MTNNIDPHRGTLAPNNKTLTCDCGRIFKVEQHPVEVDHFDSPDWEAHVLEERAKSNPAPHPKSKYDARMDPCSPHFDIRSWSE